MECQYIIKIYFSNRFITLESESDYGITAYKQIDYTELTHIINKIKLLFCHFEEEKIKEIQNKISYEIEIYENFR